MYNIIYVIIITYRYVTVRRPLLKWTDHNTEQISIFETCKFCSSVTVPVAEIICRHKFSKLPRIRACMVDIYISRNNCIFYISVLIM